MNYCLHFGPWFVLVGADNLGLISVVFFNVICIIFKRLALCHMWSVPRIHVMVVCLIPLAISLIKPPS